MPAIPAIVAFAATTGGAATIAAGATTAAAIYGANKQGQIANQQINANTAATNAQLQAQREATLANAKLTTEGLNFQKQNYNNRLTGLSPYRNVGTNALNSLAGSFGLSSSQSATPEPQPAAMSPIPQDTPAPNEMVTVVAPTGERMQMTGAQASGYTGMPNVQILRGGA